VRVQFVFAFIIIAGIVSVSVGGVPRSVSAERRTTGMGSGPTQSQPTLMADEINRRLSRLGISFNRLRIPHPYDPAGEVC
jgi:hypothetical protein